MIWHRMHIWILARIRDVDLSEKVEIIVAQKQKNIVKNLVKSNYHLIIKVGVRVDQILFRIAHIKLYMQTDFVWMILTKDFITI